MRLFLTGNSIERLEGLERAVGLTHLYLQGNNIAKLEGLDRCTALSKLCVVRPRVRRGCGAHDAIPQLPRRQLHRGGRGP